MPFVLERDELVFNGRFLRVMRRWFKDGAGQSAAWEMVQRHTHGPVVAVVAVTAEHEVLLNRIWRVPANRYVLELPAGLMDIPGEEPQACAMRELLEETGHVGDDVELIMAGPFNSGMTSDQLCVYMCSNARAVSPPQRETTEDIEVLKVPLRGLMAFLLAPPGGLSVDIKLFGILPFLQRRFPTAFADAQRP